MKLMLVCLALVALCIVETQAASKLIEKFCKNCEKCRTIDITGKDADGDPTWDCESNCENCLRPECQQESRRLPEVCRFCKKGVKVCVEKCTSGCGICFRSAEKTCNIPRSQFSNPLGFSFPPRS